MVRVKVKDGLRPGLALVFELDLRLWLGLGVIVSVRPSSRARASIKFGIRI